MRHGKIGESRRAIRRNGRYRWDLGGAGARLTLGLVLVLGWLVAGGCGVKGPPIPLRQPAPLPAVTDLTYRVSDRQVTLTWRLPSPLDRQSAKRARFIIRRSRTALDQPACENCPRVVETVGRMPYVETTDMTYTDKLVIEAGYGYAFTVHLRTGNQVGPDGDPVQFDYPSNPLAVPVEEP